MTQEELIIAKFDESVPRQLQRDMLRTVLADYQDSDKRVRRQYPPSEAITLRGHVRRADIPDRPPASRAQRNMCRRLFLQSNGGTSPYKGASRRH